MPLVRFWRAFIEALQALVFCGFCNKEESDEIKEIERTNTSNQDETNISKLEEESNDVQEFKAEIVEEVKWLMVTDEDENVKEDIWEDITSPKIRAKVTAIQVANITRIDTEEVEEEAFEHDQWLDVSEGEARGDIASKKIPLEDITVFEVVGNLQSSDEVDAEYETETQPTTEQVHSVGVQESCEDNKVVSKEIKVLRITWEELLLAERHMDSKKHAEAEIQPNNEQVHSGESHDEKVSRDTEMKEMETTEVQKSCEVNKEVAKEIKVLRLTWEELLLAERHMESAVVEDLSSDQVKSTRLTLPQEDPAIQAFKIISNDRKRSKEKKRRRKRKRKETFKSVAEEDPAILDYKEIPGHCCEIKEIEKTKTCNEDENNNSKLEEESNDVQEFKAELTEDVKWFMVTKEDENVEEGICEDITSPEIHAKVTAIQEANITRIETKEVEEEAFEHDQWLDVIEGESWGDIVSREIPLEDITVFEVARNLQWLDQVDAEYEIETQATTKQVHSVESHAKKVSQYTGMKGMKTVQKGCEDNNKVAKEIKKLHLTWEGLLLPTNHMETGSQPTTEHVHSVGNHTKKVSRDTEMKEMETAEVQESCEDTKVVSKEIKVLRLSWEELLLAERHMESKKHAEAEIQPNNEQVHSGESHDEKVSRDTEMKEMETAEVQETSEDNKEVTKEIKVFRLTWEELLLAERHMESAVVEDLSSDKVKSTRLTLTPEDPAIQAFKIISNDRKRSKEKKKRSKVKRKETLKSVAEEDSAILDYKEIPSHWERSQVKRRKRKLRKGREKAQQTAPSVAEEDPAIVNKNPSNVPHVLNYDKLQC